MIHAQCSLDSAAASVSKSCRTVGLSENIIDDSAPRRQRADRIGAPLVSCQQCRLAAAAAEINLALRARAGMAPACGAANVIEESIHEAPYVDRITTAIPMARCHSMWQWKNQKPGLFSFH